jgi:diguanylate cyclase (GGDEF)-like protein
MRMGGDEFIIYAAGMVDYEVSRRRLEHLNQAIHKVMVSEKDGVYVTVSVGGAINDGSYPTYESLYKVSDQYLYQTKAKGKDGFSLLGASYKEE